MMHATAWRIVGIADDPRVLGFQTSLPAPHTASVVAYHDLAAWDTLSPDTAHYVRLESPAWCLHTVRRFMQAGADVAAQMGLPAYSSLQIQQAALEQGEFLAPHQFYWGFAAQLQQLALSFAQHPTIRCLNHIPDILRCYDKVACHAYLQQAGIPVPRALALPTQHNVCDYAELRTGMQAQRLPRVFVKTRYGSGGSGIVALATHPRGQVEAWTTLEYHPTDTTSGRLFNSRRVRRVRQEHEIAQLITQLGAWGVQVEQWIPKASVQQHSVDIRLLMIAGEPRFQVLRKSLSPITNLHLANQRATVDELTAQLDPAVWQAVLQTGWRVAALFPQSLHLGVDVAVDVSLQRHVVLEVNAFGDFLKGVTLAGLNPYQWQLQAFLHGFEHSAIPTT